MKPALLCSLTLALCHLTAASAAEKPGALPDWSGWWTYACCWTVSTPGKANGARRAQPIAACLPVMAMERREWLKPPSRAREAMRQGGDELPERGRR